MSWVTVLCVAVATACVTLAVVHFGVWWRDRHASANLSFSLLAVGVAFFTLTEFEMMRARTPAESGVAQWWVQFPIFIMVVGIVAFIRQHFGTGRAWLGHTAWILRAMNLAVNLWKTPNVDFDVITGVTLVPFLGEPVAVAEGVTSLWFWHGHLAFMFLLAFVVDASVAAWRSGDRETRHRALALGGTIAFFVLTGALSAALIFAGAIVLPHVEFLLFLPVLVLMAYQLSGDVLRAANLSRELRASEAAARELSGRVITAQEEERKRVARDLHDDLSQRLALLSVEIDLLGRTTVGPDAGARLEQMATNVRHLSADVHRLSHELHPAKLDQLGLVTAARSWCRDLAHRSGIHIQFEAEEVPDAIAADVGLCVYRIVQEALNNVVKHSGASTARVCLSASNGTLRLEIVDEGRGFDPRAAHSTAGLGLVGIRERIRLVKGLLEIHTRPGEGTRIEVSVPLPPQEAAPSP